MIFQSYWCDGMKHYYEIHAANLITWELACESYMLTYIWALVWDQLIPSTYLKSLPK